MGRMELALIYQLAIALGLGLLIGFQREWAAKKIAGVRTFPLITILGVLSVVLAENFGGWIIAASLVAVTSFLVLGNVLQSRQGTFDPGMTSEVSALVMFAVGCVLALGYTAVAVVITGCTAVLLQWKAPIHAFVRKVGEKDLNAIMRLVLVTLVVLPLLPDADYGPYGALNPFEIWLMVVLIVGISMGAYIAYKLLGARAGSLLTGIFGGLISSTATAISYARRTARQPELAPMAAVVVVTSSAVVYVRVLFEIGVVAPGFLRAAGPPLAILMAATAAAGALAYVTARNRLVEPSKIEPPAELTAAVAFGVLYALVLFAVAAARENFGESGLYAVAALSGLTDMDAITLSTAQLIKDGTLDPQTGWRIIVVGSLANLVFKGLCVALLGGRRLAVPVALAFTVVLAIGGGLLLYWR